MIMDKAKMEVPADGHITIEMLDRYNNVLKDELDALDKVNGSKNRSDDSAMASVHAGEMRKLLMGLREHMVLYGFYNHRIEQE